MNKEQFDSIFNDCVKSLTLDTAENIEQKLKAYESDANKISATNLALFA